MKRYMDAAILPNLPGPVMKPSTAAGESLGVSGIRKENPHQKRQIAISGNVVSKRFRRPKVSIFKGVSNYVVFMESGSAYSVDRRNGEQPVDDTCPERHEQCIRLREPSIDEDLGGVVCDDLGMLVSDYVSPT